MEKIRLKCPHCGAVLQMDCIPDIEKKRITCPVCKIATPFTEFKKPKQETAGTNGSDDTTRAADNDKTSLVGDKDATQLRGTKEFLIGELHDPIRKRRYPLRPGSNLVGRKATTSTANIQIETDNKRMSRSHSLIEVKKRSSGGFMHVFTNAGNKNDTFINGKKIADGDSVILGGGEILNLGGTELKFVIHNQDETDYVQY